MNEEQYVKLYANEEYKYKKSMEQILLKRVNGAIVLENLLKNGSNVLDNCIFDRKESLDLIIKYKRYDLLGQVSIKNFLRKKDSKTKYIDFILEEFKRGNISNISFINPFDSFASLNMIADFYISYAKYGVLDHLPVISDSELLTKNNELFSRIFKDDRNFLEVLLDRVHNDELSKDIVNNLIGKSSYQNFDIAYSLSKKAKDDKRVISMPYKEGYSDKYIDNYYKDLESILVTIGEDDKRILNKLYKAAKDKCDKSSLSTLLLSYCLQITDNNPSVYMEIEKLINIFESDETFKIVKKDSPYFSEYANYIGLKDGSVDIFNHELGHMLYHKLTSSNNDYRLLSILDNIRNNPQTLDKVSKLCNTYRNLEKKVNDDAMAFYNENALIEDKDESEIREFLNKSKEELFEEYSKKGYKKELLERLLSKSYDYDAYMKQKKYIETSSLKKTARNIKLFSLQAIGDIVDAIYKGQFSAGYLKDSHNEQIKGFIGHGIYYYNSSNDRIFDEIIANYISIKKASESDFVLYNDIEFGEIYKPCDVLRCIVGDELYMYLEDFYDREILNSQKYTNTRGR